MQDALTTAIQSMQNDNQRLETIGLNMANVLTAGYKRAVPVAAPFSEAMRSAAQGVDLSAGPLQATRQPFDLALDGEGFFEVMTASGPAYTRAGRFHPDPQGRLVTAEGHPVQGVSGELVLAGAGAEIDAAGRIHQRGSQVGQVKVVRFGGAQQWERLQDGLLRPAGEAQPQPAQGTRVQAGFLEASNVKPLQEMIGLNATARHFEAAQKMYQAYEDQMSNAIRSLAQR